MCCRRVLALTHTHTCTVLCISREVLRRRPDNTSDFASNRMALAILRAANRWSPQRPEYLWLLGMARQVTGWRRQVPNTGQATLTYSNAPTGRARVHAGTVLCGQGGVGTTWTGVSRTGRVERCVVRLGWTADCEVYWVLCRRSYCWSRRWSWMIAVDRGNQQDDTTCNGRVVLSHQCRQALAL